MRVFLSGPMGCGKSTVGRELAELLGIPLVDLDSLIEEREGMSVEEIFQERGGPAFRAMERRETEHLLGANGPMVLALGGGTVTDQATRRLLLESGTLITLTASADVLAGRVASEPGRPLLRGKDAGEVLTGILGDRATAYSECHAKIRTEQRSPSEVAELAAEVVRRQPVAVPLGLRSYQVEVGAGVRRLLGQRGAESVVGRCVVLVTDENVVEPWASEAESSLEEAGFEVTRVVLPAGEEHKVLGSLERIWDAALAAGIDRESLVVGVGGGVVGDVAGLAAATLLRGVAVVHLPTTLLAMVDSSVGGKTAIDRPEGKNLVGAFHQPRFVLCDVEALASLPQEERIAGLGEVVKSAWLAGEEAVLMLERDAERLLAGEPLATERAIRMAIELKARIVVEDERESGPRRWLNLGHTVGHALEAEGGFVGLRHGEAVALGLVAAFRVAAHRNGLEPTHGKRCGALLERLGLPVDVEGRLSDETFQFLSSDKKRVGDQLAFVLPGPPGRVEIELMSVPDLRLALKRS